jgi:hypothetical protein
MTSMRLVISLVGACLVLCVAGIVLLAVLGHPVPDVLQNVAIGSLTGLVGLLVRPADRPASDTL